MRTVGRYLLTAAVWVWCGAAAAGGPDDLAGRRLYEVIPTKTPPKIDGRLDDACWKDVPVMGQFTLTLTGDGPAVNAPTDARLVYQGRFLYIGVTCHDPHPERIHRRIAAADSSAVCGDDAIEIFIHPDPQADAYYQLAANAIGTRYDGRKLDGSWNGTWQVRGAVGKADWTLEFAIDLASLGRVPWPGAVWGFNMNRERPSADPREYQCWSDTGGAFHSPERFGRIVFGGPFSGLRRIELIASSRLALQTITLEQQIARNLQVIERMWARLPANQRHKHARTHTDVKNTWTQLRRRYASQRGLTPHQWWEFTQALRRLHAQSERVAWACRFHQLLNE